MAEKMLYSCMWAAGLVKIKAHTIRQMCDRGEIKAKKIGGDWMMTRDALNSIPRAMRNTRKSKKSVSDK